MAERPEPTPAQRLRAQYVLYPIHATVGIDYEELNRDAQREVDKVARLIADIEGPIRELHRPFGIYDECGHEHTEAHLEWGDCLDIMEVGLTCEDGLMYRVCTHCCVTEGFGGGQTEECVTNHQHDKAGPICKTMAALEARRAPVNQ